MSEFDPNKQEKESPNQSVVISEDVVRGQAEQRRLEAEISVVTSRLSEIADFKRDPHDKANSYVESLVKRRAALLKKKRPPSSVSSDVRANAIETLVASISPFFRPWITVNLPYMSEGIDDTPGLAGTSGEIGTSGLYPGGLGYGASELSDDGATDPHTEKWWIHNWTCSYVFPQAPYDGRLYFRFTVDSSCLIYQAPAYSGLINEFVTVGKTADVLAQSPFDAGAWETVGWPVWVTLPHPGLVFFDGVSVPVLGSIAVKAGKTPALGLIYGTIVGLASGYVQIPWANFGTRLTLPPGTTYDGEVFDKIQYRFEPDWWIKAVTNRLAA